MFLGGLVGGLVSILIFGYSIANGTCTAFLERAMFGKTHAERAMEELESIAEKLKEMDEMEDKHNDHN